MALRMSWVCLGHAAACRILGDLACGVDGVAMDHRLAHAIADVDAFDAHAPSLPSETGVD